MLMSTPASIAGKSRGVAQVLSSKVTIPRSRATAQIAPTSCTSIVCEPGPGHGQGLRGRPLSRRSLQAVVVSAVRRPRVSKLLDTVEKDSGGALDRRVDEPSTPLLSPPALHELRQGALSSLTHASASK